MGYVLLWVEQLAVALLLVATLVACISRLRTASKRWTLWWLVVVVLLVPFALLLWGAWMLRYYSDVHLNVYTPLVAMNIAYLIGAVAIVIVAARTCAADPHAIVGSRWPRVKLAVALLVAFALLTMTLGNMDAAVKQQMTALRSEAGSMALSAVPAKVVDRENAALVYKEAFDALHALDNGEHAEYAWVDNWDEWMDPRGDAFDAHDPNLARYLEQRAGVLRLVHEAAARPGCYFDRDYGRPSLEMLMPELGELRNVARLLQLRARFRAAHGDLPGAMADVTAIARLAEHTGGEPMVISSLVAMAIDGIAGQTLQAILAKERPGEEALARLPGWQTRSHWSLLDRSLRMEEAFGLSTFCQLASGYDFAGAAGLLSEDPAPFIFGADTLYRVYLLPDDVASYRQLMREYRTLASQPYYEIRDQLDTVVNRLESREMGILTSMLAPALSQMFRAAAKADAGHRAALTGVALHRYQARHNRDPVELSELVPEFLPMVPRDPFDGKPLRLHTTDTGWTVYSIGPDGVDDGGQPIDTTGETGDITFWFDAESK